MDRTPRLPGFFEMEYKDYLNDPRWQKKRLEVFEHDKFKCICCGDDKNRLNVHHLIYYKNKLPWEYELKDIVTLCDKCHTVIHWINNGMKFNHFSINEIKCSINILENGRMD